MTIKRDGLTYGSMTDALQHEEDQLSKIRTFSVDALSHLVANPYAPHYQRAYARQLLRERGDDGD